MKTGSELYQTLLVSYQDAIKIAESSMTGRAITYAEWRALFPPDRPRLM